MQKVIVITQKIGAGSSHNGVVQEIDNSSINEILNQGYRIVETNQFVACKRDQLFLTISYSLKPIENVDDSEPRASDWR